MVFIKFFLSQPLMQWEAGCGGPGSPAAPGSVLQRGRKPPAGVCEVVMSWPLVDELLEDACAILP